MNKRIKKRTFKLYKSTTTGQVQDTIAGKNVFMQPKVFMVAALLIGIWSFVLTAEPPKVMKDAFANLPGATKEPATAQNKPVLIQQEKKSQVTPLQPVKKEQSSPAKPIDLSPPQARHAVHRNKRPLDPVSFFVNESVFTIKGTLGSGDRRMMLFEVTTKSGVRSMTLEDLHSMDIQVTSKTDCIAEIRYKKNVTLATCGTSKKTKLYRKVNQPKLKL